MSYKKRYYPDWDCIQCGERKIFGSKDKCNKCGCYRSKGVPSKNDAVPTVKAGDWTCICGVNNFAKRDKCFKCNAPKAPVEVKEEVKTCIVCMDRPLEVLITKCKHICMCNTCCQALSLCPMCRMPYNSQTDIDRVFVSV